MPFLVSEILVWDGGGGGVFPTPSQMPLSCLKRQMPLTVKSVSGGPMYTLSCFPMDYNKSFIGLHR